MCPQACALCGAVRYHADMQFVDPLGTACYMNGPSCIMSCCVAALIIPLDFVYAFVNLYGYELHDYIQSLIAYVVIFSYRLTM